ncbi:hypothetical protein PoB_007072200 [Plakobranchus ocellatus]|uniref:Secreted protein n=1 Tax=Plakobranchus ocellatus TaxID=259542 RepID=A0AAV4DIX5_9GAST|nr:hypothetical protein PoB_007072200 [Plakobranchus ocellatus]
MVFLFLFSVIHLFAPLTTREPNRNHMSFHLDCYSFSDTQPHFIGGRIEVKIRACVYVSVFVCSCYLPPSAGVKKRLFKGWIFKQQRNETKEGTLTGKLGGERENIRSLDTLQMSRPQRDGRCVEAKVGHPVTDGWMDEQRHARMDGWIDGCVKRGIQSELTVSKKIQKHKQAKGLNKMQDSTLFW